MGNRLQLFKTFESFSVGAYFESTVSNMALATLRRGMPSLTLMSCNVLPCHVWAVL